MQNPQEREHLVRTHAQAAAQLQAAILKRDADACLPLATAMISDDFVGLERDALEGELPIRMQLHEIIDEALRHVVFADDTTSDAWKEVVLPDEYGLYKHFPLASNARWLRLTHSPRVDEGLEAITDIARLAGASLREQALQLARFCAVNDGATQVDYPALRKALDPRLVAYLDDWVLCVALYSPRRFASVEAARNQDALRRAFIDVHRNDRAARPSSSDQASAAFFAPYALEENTRALAMICNGKQMTALTERFRPTPEACEQLANAELSVHALEELPETDQLILCPNWSEDHVIHRCMSPLVEGMRERGVPLLRVASDDAILPPISLEWFENTIDVAHSASHMLTHLGAIAHALRERKPELVFYPEITPANSTFWMATERVARVQATGYGFPVTTGLPTMDYFLAGADVEREGAEADYSEQLILLPGMAVSTTRPPLPSGPRERDDAELRLVATTSIQKLNIELLRAWDAILAQHPTAKLDVFTNATASQLGAYLEDLGRWLTHGDVVVHTAQPRQAVLDTLAQADLFLDAYPYGGFNSLVEPLSTACPVVTLEGERARNRLGAALLRRAGLPETLVARDWKHYVEHATRLLADAGERHALRAQLADRERLFAALNDPDLPHHMDAAIDWMLRQGPPKSRRAPVFIRAGEKPVVLSA